MDKIELIETMVKYTILTGVATIALWAFLLSNNFTLTPINYILTIVQCFCIILMAATHKKLYKKLCGCCHNYALKKSMNVETSLHSEIKTIDS